MAEIKNQNQTHKAEFKNQIDISQRGTQVQVHKTLCNSNHMHSRRHNDNNTYYLNIITYLDHCTTWLSRIHTLCIQFPKAISTSPTNTHKNVLLFHLTKKSNPPRRQQLHQTPLRRTRQRLPSQTATLLLLLFRSKHKITQKEM